MLDRLPARSWVMLVTLLALLFGCTPDSARRPLGDAEVVVSTRSALTGADVARVHLTVSGPGIAPPIESDLAPSGGAWRGTLSRIPAGPERLFHADAFDASSNVIFTGEAAHVTIVDGMTAFLALVLQEVAPPPPFSNASPVVDSATATTTTIAPNGTVTLTATAHDPNAGDTLTYAWSATAGSFTAPASLSTGWTAPATTGDQTLTLRVTDSHGAIGAISIVIHVASASSGGSSEVTTSFNGWPEVQRVVADPGRLDGGESAQVSVFAIDPDDLMLTYQWTTTCDGTFAQPTEPRTTFTLATPSGDCALTVTVSDPRGGTNIGSLGIVTGPGPTVTEAGDIVGPAFQSATWAIAGDVITFSIASTSDATFAWSASSGTFGGPSSTSRASQVGWVAPMCAPGLDPHVTVTISDVSTGASFPLVFPISVYCSTPPETLTWDADAIYGVSGGPAANTWTYQGIAPWDPALGTLKKVRIANSVTWNWRDGATLGSTPPVDHYQMPIGVVGWSWTHYRAFEVAPNTTRSASFVDYVDVIDATPWTAGPTLYTQSVTDHYDHHISSSTTIAFIYAP